MSGLDVSKQKMHFVNGVRRRAAPRTASACLACKQRKIKVRRSPQNATPLPLTESYKCTGQPGPCQACREYGRYCHFDFKLDARRKTAYRPSTTQWQQQFILKGLLLSIKFNDYDMIQRLVDAIKNGDSPPNVARSIQNNIDALHERVGLTKQAISETDLITLVLRCLACSRPRSRMSSLTSAPPDDLLGHFSSSPSELSSACPASNVDRSSDDTSPFQSSNSDTGQYWTEFAHPLEDFASISISNTFEVCETLV